MSLRGTVYSYAPKAIVLILVGGVALVAVQVWTWIELRTISVIEINSYYSSRENAELAGSNGYGIEYAAYPYAGPGSNWLGWLDGTIIDVPLHRDGSDTVAVALDELHPLGLSESVRGNTGGLYVDISYLTPVFLSNDDGVIWFVVPLLVRQNGSAETRYVALFSYDGGWHAAFHSLAYLGEYDDWVRSGTRVDDTTFVYEVERGPPSVIGEGAEVEHITYVRRGATLEEVTTVGR